MKPANNKIISYFISNLSVKRSCEDENSEDNVHSKNTQPVQVDLCII